MDIESRIQELMGMHKSELARMVAELENQAPADPQPAEPTEAPAQ